MWTPGFRGHHCPGWLVEPSTWGPRRAGPGYQPKLPCIPAPCPRRPPTWRMGFPLQLGFDLMANQIRPEKLPKTHAMMRPVVQEALRVLCCRTGAADSPLEALWRWLPAQLSCPTFEGPRSRAEDLVTACSSGSRPQARAPRWLLLTPSGRSSGR